MEKIEKGADLKLAACRLRSAAKASGKVNETIASAAQRREPDGPHLTPGAAVSLWIFPANGKGIQTKEKHDVEKKEPLGKRPGDIVETPDSHWAN